MDNLKMHSMNKVDDNISKIGKLFPNCVTEHKNDNGEVEYGVDFDMLKQELSSVVIDSDEERYQFTWPDKKKAILEANAPISKTLRPCREESVDFDNTENLYIEGDNLEVLKLLQETYLGKIKMIYIDPPYNTGNDFVYNDDFAESADDYLANSGQFDDEGNRLVQNTESNGRFHTDWLNMLYPRLKLAKDLLSNDGAIFISIDDNELKNLLEITNEIFGESNFVEIFSWAKTETPANLAKKTKKSLEYVVCYQKSSDLIKFTGLKKESKSSNGLMNQTNSEKYLIFPANKVDTAIPDGIISKGEYGTNNYKIILLEDTEVKDGFFIKPIKLNGKFKWTQDKLNTEILNGTKISIRSISFSPSYEKNEYAPEAPWNIINSKFNVGTNETASTELKELMNNKIFDYAKPVSLLKYLSGFLVEDNDFILDFFSGSATTAHAVMQLNAEDGGNRKFIMVQLPEATDEKSEAYKAGYKNICEIGKERIRRAGAKIKEENGLAAQNLDIGFRVLKCDSSNMKDVYYSPAEFKSSLFDNLEDNIKEDRTAEDLLFQVMLDLGVMLSSKIEETTIAGKKVFNVADGFLIACFDNNVTDDVVTEIAKKQPYYFVMRDSSMANDAVATNFDQIFNTFSPNTVRKVL